MILPAAVRRARRRPSLAAAALVAVLAAAACTSTLAGHPAASARSASPGSSAAAGGPGGAAGPAEPAPTGVVLGSASAPVQVAVYEDLGCPPCARFATSFAPVVQSELATGKVAFHYYDVAILDREFAGTDYSTRAANAALCADRIGGAQQYLAVHAALLDHQPAEGTAGLDDAELIALAQAAGTTSPAFPACVRAQTYASSVHAATGAFRNLGIAGVPALFVGATPVSPLTATAARTAIDAAR